MSQQVTVSEVARELSVEPRAISDLFYKRVLSDSVAPVVGGRRLIPRTYIREIRHALREAGRLPAEGSVARAS